MKIEKIKTRTVALLEEIVAINKDIKMYRKRCPFKDGIDVGKAHFDHAHIAEILDYDRISWWWNCPVCGKRFEE